MDYRELQSFAQSLDRAFFIDTEEKKYASRDAPLPIGYGQTISQPSLVLKMTHLLSPDRSCSVLEIGTGSGYQTALLAEFSGHVYTVERIAELSLTARSRLEQLGYANVTCKIGDGSRGWEENAPFDRIMVTAAAAELPAELIRQLKPGGIMVIPLGPEDVQELQLITKDETGAVGCRTVAMVRFVELKGPYGWSGQDRR